MKGGADLDNSRPAPFFFGYYYENDFALAAWLSP
jgi:hypothetical protein